MTERRVWSTHEDNVLKEIIEKLKITRWSQVSREMKQRFNIHGRTGKQCRERWHNQLDPQIKQEPWTEEEERNLFRLHSIHGNKWAKIAESLPGRTDNSIKNYFYSTLRRGLRRLNKFISDERATLKAKQIKGALLHKIIQLSGFKNSRKTPNNHELINQCFPIIEKLVACSKEEHFARANHSKLRSLITDLEEFDHKLIRRKYTKRKNIQKSQQQQPEAEPIEPEVQPVPSPQHSPQLQRSSPPIYRKATNNSLNSLRHHPSRSFMFETERSRSRSRHFDDQPAGLGEIIRINTKQLMTSSVESMAIFNNGFQRIQSQPDFPWAILNPLSGDQTQQQLMMSTKNLADLREGNNTQLRTKFSLKRRGTLDELH